MEVGLGGALRFRGCKAEEVQVYCTCTDKDRRRVGSTVLQYRYLLSSTLLGGLCLPT